MAAFERKRPPPPLPPNRRVNVRLAYTDRQCPVVFSRSRRNLQTKKTAIMTYKHRLPSPHCTAPILLAAITKAELNCRLVSNYIC